MDIGVGLPATVPGVRGSTLLTWAERVDAGPFSSLGIIDRLTGQTHEPMMVLAGAAAVTGRVRLLTTVVLAPTRNGAILAKEAASLDALSGGRLTLGLGVGSRPDNYHLTGSNFHRRGAIFDRQLLLMTQTWRSQEAMVGPPPSQPGGPPILIAGYAPAALQRLARWGIGYMSGIVSPQDAAVLLRRAERVWRDAGRAGRPRLVGGIYVAVGPGSAQRGADFLRGYYGQERGASVAASMPCGIEELRRRLEGYAQIGMDEVILWPTEGDPDVVDRLAEALPLVPSGS